jgi:histidinol-phosphate aminotransferase
VALVRRGRARLEKGLAALGLPSIPSETNFVYFDCGEPAQRLRSALHRRRILVARPFPAAPNWLRAAVGTEADVEALLSALREIRGEGDGSPKKG